MGTSLQSFLVSIPIAIILWALMLLAVAVAVVLMAEPRASAAAAARSRAARSRAAQSRAARSGIAESDVARSGARGSRAARWVGLAGRGVVGLGQWFVGRLLAGRLLANRLLFGRLFSGRLFSGSLFSGSLLSDRLFSDRLLSRPLLSDRLLPGRSVDGQSPAGRSLAGRWSARGSAAESMRPAHSAGEPNTGVPGLAARVASVPSADHLPAGERAAGDLRARNGITGHLAADGVSAGDFDADRSSADRLTIGLIADNPPSAAGLTAGHLAGEDLAGDRLPGAGLTAGRLAGEDLAGDPLPADDLSAGRLAAEDFVTDDPIEDELRFAGEVSVAAARAAATAARCRSEWEAAQDELDLAWAAYEEADAVARRTWGATSYPLMSRRRKLGDNADRERYLHHAAAEACRRRELSIAQLNDVYAHRGWNPRLHPVVQEALLHNAIRENRFAAYQAAQRRERAAWQRSEVAAEALRVLRAEAAAAFGRAAVEEPAAGEFWWAEPWTTSELPVAA